MRVQDKAGSFACGAQDGDGSAGSPHVLFGSPLRGRNTRVRLNFLFLNNFPAMPNTTPFQPLRRLILWTALALLFLGSGRGAPAQTAKNIPPKIFEPGGTATLEADTQRAVGKTFYADGHVDMTYENARLRADHVEYNSETQTVIATGHVQLDYMTQHVEASDARLRTENGPRHIPSRAGDVRGAAATHSHAADQFQSTLFRSRGSERLNDTTYRVTKAWVTGCDPRRPTWKFYAPNATVELRQSVRMVNGNVRIF